MEDYRLHRYDLHLLAIQSKKLAASNNPSEESIRSLKEQTFIAFHMLAEHIPFRDEARKRRNYIYNILAQAQDKITR